MNARATKLGALTVAAVFGVIACGETREGNGGECLRGDDCLSGSCTDRVCVASPPLGTPPSGAASDAASSADAGAQNDAGEAPDSSGAVDAGAG